MKNYYVTIISINPKDQYGKDNQKYGFSLVAKDEKGAEEKAIIQFKTRYKELPILGVKVF